MPGPRRLLPPALACLLLLALALAGGPYYGRLLLPVYRAEIAWLAPDYEVLSLEVAPVRGEAAIVLHARATAPVAVAGRLLAPGFGVSADTLLAHAVLHPLLMFGLLLAWPGLAPRARLEVCLLALPLLLMVELADVPLVLLGSIADLLQSQVAPGNAPGSPLISWMNLLNGGGRLALSLAGGLVAVAARHLLHGSPPGTSSAGSPLRHPTV